MGCGQSKIRIYHRKSKADKNEKPIEEEREGSEDETSDSNRLEPNGSDPSHDQPEREHSNYGNTPDITSHLVETSEISTSQIDFFKMLDEKIDNGPDYEENEQEREQERQRLLLLLKDWIRKPQIDTQRFPTAYEQCPPGRPFLNRYGPRPPIYSQPRPYMFSPSMSIESTDIRGQDRYLLDRREDLYSLPPENYGISQEGTLSYNRTKIQGTFTTPNDSPEMYARNRALISKTAGRALSLDAGQFSRYPISERDSQLPGLPNDFSRDMHFSQHIPYVQHSALPYPQQPLYVNYGMGPNMGQDTLQYIARPPPREMPPLQGVPGPPHGSPRPMAVRLPTNVAWRRPRGPVSELA